VAKKTKLGTSGQVDPKLKKQQKQAERENRQLKKSARRADKSDIRLDNARAKLEARQPYKPPGLGKRAVQTASGEVGVQAHRKIREVERENAAVESAHEAEIYAERTVRIGIRRVKQHIRSRPARRVRKLEKQNIQRNADFRFRQMAKQNPDLKKNALKRYLHKKRIQRMLAKQSKAATQKAALSAAVKTKAVLKPVILLAKNPKFLLILGICLLLIFVIQACAGMVLTMFGGLGGSVIGATSYLAEDEDIDEAVLRYSEWEIDLLLEAMDAENSHPGYDEYIFNIDDPGHDPFALIAYLTAKHENFTFAEIEAELRDIFDEQYTLTFDPSVEIRYSWEQVGWEAVITGYDPVAEVPIITWVPVYDWVPYEWHILTVTLTARDFEDVIIPRLTEDEQGRYNLLMLTKGNRQYVNSPFPFNWLPYVSDNYGYRIHPIDGTKEYHTGVDIALPEGTPILAGGAGVVAEAGENGDYGYAILIDYGGGISARYAHCSELFFTAGQTVQAGDIIALVGSTGASTGAHLHMEVIKDGRFLNPFFFVTGTVDF